MFDDVGIGSACMNQLSARRVDKSAVHGVAGAEFHLLAECSHINGLVAFNAADIVVSWSEAILDRLPFAKDKQVIFECAVASCCRWFGLSYALIDGCASSSKAVK